MKISKRQQDIYEFIKSEVKEKVIHLPSAKLVKQLALLPALLFMDILLALKVKA